MSLPPFPAIDFDDPDDKWEWPLPAFIRASVLAPRDDQPHPCELEARPGTVTHGEMLEFRPDESAVVFRLSADGRPLRVPFDRFCRLTLTTPLTMLPAPLGGMVKRMPCAEEERSYRAQTPHGLLTGRTLAHVDTPLGLFLFPPYNEDQGVQRVFLPAGCFRRVDFGPSAVDEAAEHWVGARDELEHALRKPAGRVPPIGEALIALGLITRTQLSAALARDDREGALGEYFVRQGFVSRADLETALAHKMGYPIVDLTRFPIDPEARRRIPVAKAVEYRVLPLMQMDGGIVVAVDRLSRIAKLGELQAFLQTRIIPVLAPRKHLRLASAGLLKDQWGGFVPGTADIFHTTL